MADVTADARARQAAGERRRLRLELIATAVLALATVLTAWSAFESTKWSGVQADNYSTAGAERTESVRESNRANTLTAIDVNTFVAWASAVAGERDGTTPSAQPYAPQAGTLSGFLFERFRDEFRPAVVAWLATDPLTNPDAPPTPFDMKEYRLSSAERADALERSAEAHRETARRANQTGDNYVLMTVLFASVLLFAGVSTELDGPRARRFMLGLALVVIIATAAALVTFPVEI